MLLGQLFREQASVMKGSSFTMGHEPLEYKKQLITFMVRSIFPKLCREIWTKHRRQTAGGFSLTTKNGTN